MIDAHVSAIDMRCKACAILNRFIESLSVNARHIQMTMLNVFPINMIGIRPNISVDSPRGMQLHMMMTIIAGSVSNESFVFFLFIEWIPFARTLK